MNVDEDQPTTSSASIGRTTKEGPKFDKGSIRKHRRQIKCTDFGTQSGPETTETSTQTATMDEVEQLRAQVTMLQWENGQLRQENENLKGQRLNLDQG